MRKLIRALETKTNFFVLPMLGQIKRYFENSYCTFLNSYIGDVNMTNYDDFLILSYAYNGELAFGTFEQQLEWNENFVTSYIPDEGILNFVFKIPEQYKEDYKLFKEGKYSKFSEEYKKRIIAHFGLKKKGSIYGVLYRTEEYKKVIENKFTVDENKPLVIDPEWDIEYYDKIDIHNEMYPFGIEIVEIEESVKE